MAVGDHHDRNLCARLRAVAVDAGDRILNIRESNNLTLRTKPDGSPVSNADEESNNLILAILNRIQPHVPIVSEETSVPDFDPDHPFFLVDPLDGTDSFIRGKNAFTVNIALVRQRVPVLGVVYAPAMRVCYWTDGPDSAHRDDWTPALEIPRSKEIRAEFPGDAGDISSVVSELHLDPRTSEWLDREGIVLRRPIGSSIKFCLVASGEAAVYPRFAPMREWDTAAGCAVLRAAGGTVLKTDGQSPLRFGSQGLVTEGFIACAKGYRPRIV